MLVFGCAQYAADHVLDHSPRNSYEKQAALCLDELRNEYAKAFGRLNIFASIEGHLKGAGTTGSWGPLENSGAGDTAAPGNGRYQRIEA